jgi:hypothetical protein
MIPSSTNEFPNRSPRLAIVSTPRSGNTWVRSLLGKAVGCPSLSVHRPGDLDWDTLPAACILQVHWRPTPEFIAQLNCYRFQVVVVSRHPLDVLISILHFALHDNSTLYWLDGDGGDERSIRGAMPCSRAFLNYATSDRVAKLLSISRQWWRVPGVGRLRYEDLVANPAGEVSRLVRVLDMPLTTPIDAAVADSTLSRLRAETQCMHHFWQGRPGLWRTLLAADVARAIAETHAGHFKALDYECDPDPLLDRRRADSLWLDLIRHELSVRLWAFVRTRHLLDVASNESRQEAGLLANAKPLYAMASSRAVRAFRGLLSASH